MDVATAEAALTRARQEVREAEREIEKTEAEVARFQAKESVNTQDVVAHENAKRRLPRLRSDLAESQETLAAAESALAAAQRDRDLATVAAVRAKVAPRREKLDARMGAIADDARPVEETVFALLESDPFLANLRAEIVDLQTCLAPLTGITTLAPTQIDAGAGAWAFFDTGGGFAFFNSIVSLVHGLVRARREEAERIERERIAAEERAEAERIETERRSLEPQFGPDADGRMRWFYTPEAARKIPVPEAHIQLARMDPHRAIAMFDPRQCALIAAKDKQARAALERAAAAQSSPVALGGRPAHERDALDLGTRIEVEHHHPEED